LFLGLPTREEVCELFIVIIVHGYIEKHGDENVSLSVSKALLMSVVTNIVRNCGYLVLKPSKRYMVVEWWCWKPCCEGASSMCGVICLRISHSKIWTWCREGRLVCMKIVNLKVCLVSKWG